MYFATDSAETYYKLIEVLEDEYGIKISKTPWGFRDNELINGKILLVTQSNVKFAASKIATNIDEDGAIQLFKNNMIYWERKK